MQVVWCRLGQGLGRREERVRELGRMRQGAARLGPPPVGHQPARDGDGHRHERQQRRDQQRYDEPDLGHANLLVAVEAAVDSLLPDLLGLPVDGEDGVGLDEDLFSELARVDGTLDLVLALALLPAERVDVGAVLRLALAEADSDVALELDGARVGELERVEDGGEVAALPVVLPVAEDLGVGGAAVVVRHRVDRLVVLLVHRLGDAVPGEPAVDLARRDLDLEHELVSDLGLADVGSVRVADAHGARGRRACVGDRAGGGERGHVEALLEVVRPGGVDTLDAVRLRGEGHQLGMFLHDEDEGGDALVVEEAARAELDVEVDGSTRLALLDRESALGVVAVTLDVHDAVEVGVGDDHVDLDAVGETVDNDLGAVERLGNNWRRWNGNASVVRISSVALNALADTSVVDGRGVGVLSAGIWDARIATGLIGATPFEGGALRIDCALWLFDATSEVVKDVIGRTDAFFSSGVEDEPLGPIAYASAVLNDEAEVESARDALAGRVNHVTRRTHALQILVQDQALSSWASFYRCALDRGISLVTREALASHGSDGEGVQNGAFGVQPTRIGQAARLLTLPVDASSLGGTL